MGDNAEPEPEQMRAGSRFGVPPGQDRKGGLGGSAVEVLPTLTLTLGLKTNPDFFELKYLQRNEFAFPRLFL